MEFGKAFTFPFEDQEWAKKIAIVAVITLIPIVGQLVAIGWALEVTRRVIRKETEVLPAMDNFGGMLGDGFKSAVISFVYMLPFILLESCGGGVFSFTSNDSDLTTIGIIVFSCLSCLALILVILLGLLLPAALGKFAATNKLGAAFKFGEVFGLVRAAPGPYFMVLLGTIVAGIVGSLGTIACVIGALFTMAYSFAINGHLWGQAYLAAGGDVSSDDDFGASFGADPDATIMTEQ